MTIDTTYLDSGADKIKLARPAILAMAQKLNTTDAFMTHPSNNILGYGRNWFDIQVPVVADFIDNVFSVQNKSHGSGLYGNAAIAFLDSAGTERGAVGYSRNNAIQPTGYYPNTLYLEVGNPFTTDAQFTHFRVINTVKVGSASWGGVAKSYFPIEVLSDTGAITLSNGGGGAPILLDGPAIAAQGLSVGDLSYGVPAQHSVAMTTAAVRFREYGTANQFAITSNVSNLNPASISKDAPASSAWKIDYGSGFDRFQISRCAAGASTWIDFLTVKADGTACFTKQIRSQLAPSEGWSVSVDDALPVTVNNGATYSLSASSGVVMINDYTGGQAAVYLCSASSIVLISQTGTQYVVGAPGAGKVGIVWSGSAYQISNNKGSNTTFGVMTFATRQSN